MASSKGSSNSDVNILLLGETGVGKSTFINAFANYVFYEKLDDALREDLLWLIPASFTVTDADTFEQKAVKIGEDPNETFITGQSSTQNCRIYVFPIDEHRNWRYKRNR
jgi:predicted GTPase